MYNTSINQQRYKMIKVRECDVDTCDCEVTVNYITFQSMEDLWNYIEDEYGLEDVHDKNIKEGYEEDDDIVFEQDVGFVQWELL